MVCPGMAGKDGSDSPWIEWVRKGENGEASMVSICLECRRLEGRPQERYGTAGENRSKPVRKDEM